MPWSKIVDELCNDPLLSHLEAEAAHSVMRILTLVLYADTDKGIVEQVEFERMMAKLPWFEGKDEKLHELAEEAHALAAKIHDEDAFTSAVQSSAKVLEAARDASRQLAEPRDIRNYVFTMAASLAAADGSIHEHEQHTLDWLAHAFHIDEAAAQRLTEEALVAHS